MLERFPTPVAIALATSIAGCYTPRATPVPDPFKVPAAQVGSTLRVVALVPVGAPGDLPDVELTKGRFLSTIEARLREVGISVVPATEVDPIVAEARERSGGLYDPKTGKLDPAKEKAFVADAMAHLEAKVGHVDALVFPHLRVVIAPFSSDEASWHGTTEYAGSSDWKKVTFLNLHKGRLKALSLVVYLLARDGTYLYVGAGGLQLVQKVDVWGTIVPVPTEQLLADEQRNWTAVYLATEPLLAAVRAARTPGAPAPVASP